MTELPLVKPFLKKWNENKQAGFKLQKPDFSREEYIVRKEAFYEKYPFLLETRLVFDQKLVVDFVELYARGGMDSPEELIQIILLELLVINGAQFDSIIQLLEKKPLQ